MNYFLIFISLLSVPQLFAQDSLTASDLQGTWHFTAERIEKSDLINEDVPFKPGFEWIYPDVHWIIKGNKIYEIAYPCCLQKTYTFSTGKDAIFVRQGRGVEYFTEIYEVKFPKDSLVLENWIYTSRTMYLEKDTLPEKEIQQLIKGTINPTCLYGDWEIPVGEVSVPYDAIMVWYPYKLPETIHIDAKNIRNYWSKNLFYLEVDGVKKSFKLAGVSLNDDNMTLIPQSWVKKYQEESEYDRYDGSNVWLRKIPKEEE